MLVKIRLNNIQLYGWHGVTDKEKQMGQQFEIDIEVMVNIDLGIETDDIKKTVNYNDNYCGNRYLAHYTGVWQVHHTGHSWYRTRNHRLVLKFAHTV